MHTTPTDQCSDCMAIIPLYAAVKVRGDVVCPQCLERWLEYWKEFPTAEHHPRSATLRLVHST